MTAAADTPSRARITGAVLAGGRGSRMGGVDKGLVDWHGVPLARHALLRLQPQVARCCISANRHAGDYARFGVPVLPDPLPGYAGPLAGLLAALQHAGEGYVATVPCDVPHFPDTLVRQLADGLAHSVARVAVAEAPEAQPDGLVAWRRQPVFSLVHHSLAPSLEEFLRQGGRKAGLWLDQQRAVGVRIAAAPGAFANANTAAELQALPR